MEIHKTKNDWNTTATVTAAYGERLKLEEDIETHVLASIE